MLGNRRETLRIFEGSACIIGGVLIAGSQVRHAIFVDEPFNGFNSLGILLGIAAIVVGSMRLANRLN